MRYSVQLDELSEADLDPHDAFIDAAGKEEAVAVILFPRVRTTRGIVRVLRTLDQGSRWSASRVPWGKYERDGAAQVGLRFRTTEGHLSSAMGFAPLGCMPVTRRAPYVALAIWAGSKSNSHKRTRAAGEIGFIDIAMTDKEGNAFDREAHQRLWNLTKANVGQVLGDPVEDGFVLKDVAFCLPETNVADLFVSA